MTMGKQTDEAADAQWRDMPLELQLDLLVDAELPDPQRRVLLRKLEQRAEMEEWRDLAIRFLHRQVEKQTVRDLMAGGSILPLELLDITPPRRFRLAGWLRSPGVMATAAGMLIAATSAVITLYIVRDVAPLAGAAGPSGGAKIVEFTGNLPGEALGVDKGISVRVPMRPGQDVNFFPAGMLQQGAGFERNARGTTPAGAGSRRSVVIQPDGKGNAVAIPVNLMNVY
jgi:hypothetical protein